MTAWRSTNWCMMHLLVCERDRSDMTECTKGALADPGSKLVWLGDAICHMRDWPFTFARKV